MVSAMTVTIAAMLGLMVYIAVPIAVMTAPVQLRHRIGKFYGKIGARALKQFVFVRRILSGYDVLPINVDDEQKLLKATLTSNTLGEDNEFRFADPDNRIKRLWNKPVAVAYEGIPAAVSPELAEKGHWVRQKKIEDGLHEGRAGDEYDPWVPMDDGLRLSDPVDAHELVDNDVDPENIKTAEQLTKKRFEKYGSGLGVREALGGVMGFFSGLGGVIALVYVRDEVLGESTEMGGTTLPTPTIDMTPVVDGMVQAMVMLL